MRSLIVTAIASIFLTGCAAKVGPYNTKTDSVAYNKAIQQGSDKQLLLNIVRMKYRDNPTFLDIGIVSAAYEFKRSGNVNFKFDTSTASNIGISPTFGIDYLEKPTTTYQLLKGEGLVKQIMSPISIQTLYLLNSSGWRIDRILRCCVQRMNNLNNAVSASRPTPSMAPEYERFLELTKLLHELESNEDIEIIADQNSETGKFEFLLQIDPKSADKCIMNKIWTLLDLEPETYDIKLVPYHSRENKANEVHVDTRSPLSVLYFLSQGVHAPLEDQEFGLVTTTYDRDGNLFDWDRVLGGIISIHSDPCSCNECDYGVSVNYRGHTFYIRDTDLTSKSTFSLLSQLLALQTGNPIIPVYTLQLN
jgi:hypothetical protein